MSGATTGAARPTLYTQWDREVGAILTARALYLQGIRPGDVVINAWAYSTHNGAFSFDEALHRWLSCVVITTGTGNVTSSRRQIELARAYQATAILTTGDYLLHLAEVAREMGLDPTSRSSLRALPNLGDRARLEGDLRGPRSTTPTASTRCSGSRSSAPRARGCTSSRTPSSCRSSTRRPGARVPDGQLGSLCITEIYKTGSPQFRYDILDLSFLHPRGQCACGSWLRRIGPFAGRGDNMVKLRGVNVWPEAIGRIASALPGAENDYFVRALREADRDEMSVSVVSRAEGADAREALRAQIELRLKEELGVRIRAELVLPGELDAWTEIHTAPKPKRFRDER